MRVPPAGGRPRRLVAVQVRGAPPAPVGGDGDPILAGTRSAAGEGLKRQSFSIPTLMQQRAAARPVRGAGAVSAHHDAAAWICPPQRQRARQTRQAAAQDGHVDGLLRAAGGGFGLDLGV
jgi:hypothetical protein